MVGIVTGLFVVKGIVPIIYLRGDYFLVVTIDILEIVCVAFITDIFGLTGGANGFIGIGCSAGWEIYILAEFQILSGKIYRPLEG
ncbi:MAG: hypothetical protein AMR96_06645 [Candidatus Adiutrix intracellularis]|jgi:ABC-type branched-subunit amino acid transport system permease subunit|nr:MAG: hypothetical protein AMR96_06645 [Candidatus Adiutrix intracellularis]MDR2827117.1 hypothetical protein [Candidatus Adiutrix intracellularis]